MASSPEEILKAKFANLARGVREKLQNEQYRQKHQNLNDFVNRMDALNKQLVFQQQQVQQQQQANPDSNPALKAAKLWRMAQVYFGVVEGPKQEAAKKQKQEQDMLQYFLHKMIAKQEAKMGMGDGAKAELEALNTEGEDLENHLSDEQIEQLIENDPGLPDNLGGFDKDLKELEEEAEELKQNKDEALDATDDVRKEFLAFINSLANPKGSRPDNVDNPEEEQEENKKKRRGPRPPTPFGGNDPSNPYS